MKNKYIAIEILMAASWKPKRIKSDIYGELEKTIAERKKLIKQFEKTVDKFPKCAEGYALLGQVCGNSYLSNITFI